MKPLPLYPGAKPCQRTGFCCEKGPCCMPLNPRRTDYLATLKALFGPLQRNEP